MSTSAADRAMAAVERFEVDLAEAAHLARLKLKEFLTPEEAAELGYFTSALAAAQMRCKGQGPKWSRLSDGTRGRVAYRRSDLDAWADSREALVEDSPKVRALKAGAAHG